MITIYEFTDDALTGEQPLYLACGIFDGVHRGHQAILRRTCALAQLNAGHAVALTFHPHPRTILTPDNAPPLLSTPAMRQQLFAAAGLDGCVMINFTAAFSRLSPAEFLDSLLQKLPRLHGLVVGADWRFAYQQSGTVEILHALTAAKKLELAVVASVDYAGEKISSTRIRRALGDGDLTTAAAMLGRDFGLSNTVQNGRQIARTLGFPTANLAFPAPPPLPPGSYAATVTIADQIYPATVYLGTRPTYAAADLMYYVEAHLLNVELNLYGREIAVQFRRLIRREQKFAEVAALRAAIAADVAITREFFAQHQPCAFKKL